MRSPTESMHGFTLIEVILASAIGALLLASAVAVWHSANELSKESYRAVRTEAEHRRDTAALTNLLRGVPSDTLVDLDESGRSTRPGFQQVVAAEGTTVQLGPVVYLEWSVTPEAGTVPDGRRIGAVHLLDNGQRTLMANMVVEGGFAVSLRGRMLLVELTDTWKPPGGGDPHLVTSQEAVFLRN